MPPLAALNLSLKHLTPELPPSLWACRMRLTGYIVCWVRFSVKPDDLPDAIFASIGRSVLRDLGPVCYIFRLINKLMDANMLASITSLTAHTMDDYKKNLKD